MVSVRKGSETGWHEASGIEWLVKVMSQRNG